MDDKVRISLLLPPGLYREIEAMAGESATTMGEIVGRALALLKAARDCVKNGSHVGTVEDARKLDQEFVGI